MLTMMVVSGLATRRGVVSVKLLQFNLSSIIDLEMAKLRRDLREFSTGIITGPALFKL